MVGQLSGYSSHNPCRARRIGYAGDGRPPHDVRRSYASFRYQAGSWTKPRRVIAKVEWHPGELFPRVGFIVTNLTRAAKKVVAFCAPYGECGQEAPYSVRPSGSPIKRE
jgi:hypothetical protein